MPQRLMIPTMEQKIHPQLLRRSKKALLLFQKRNIKLAERQAKFIRNLNNALIRIENNTWDM